MISLPTGPLLRATFLSRAQAIPAPRHAISDHTVSIYVVALADTHITGSFVEQPVGTELASRISGVEPARRRPEAPVVPAVGWLVTMKALQVGGESVVVSVVSNQTCAMHMGW